MRRLFRSGEPSPTAERRPTEARKTHTGRITYIDATDTRYVTVRVEMSNKELNLLDHSAATIIVPPTP